MKLIKFIKTVLALMSVCVLGVTCTKLDVKVYSVLANEDFWKTPEEIAAGKAPAYQALTGVGPDHSGFWIQARFSARSIPDPRYPSAYPAVDTRLISSGRATWGRSES